MAIKLNNLKLSILAGAQLWETPSMPTMDIQRRSVLCLPPLLLLILLCISKLDCGDEDTQSAPMAPMRRFKGKTPLHDKYNLYLRFHGCNPTWYCWTCVAPYLGHFTHEPRALTMKLWEPKRNCPKVVSWHLRIHVVWSRTLKCTVKSYVTRPSTKCYFHEFLFMRVLTYDNIE